MGNLHTIDLSNGWEVPAGACWRRRFGRPTGLGPADRIWLVIDSAAGASAGHVRGDVLVNGVALPSLGGTGVRRADIAPLLRPRNELVVAVPAVPAPADAESPPAGRRRSPPWVRRVWLEIDAAD